MTRKQYLEIRDNESKDTSPVYYFLWLLRGGQSLSSNDFQQLFWTWVFQTKGLHSLVGLQTFVFKELDEYFEVT